MPIHHSWLSKSIVFYYYKASDIFWVLFPIKSILPERILIGIGLIIASTVYIFEGVRIQLSLLIFQPWRLSLFIIFATPCKVVIVLSLMGTIAFYISRTLNSTWESGISPLLTILILQYTWIHVCFANCGNIASDVKAPIDKAFGSTTTLNVPNI